MSGGRLTWWSPDQRLDIKTDSQPLKVVLHFMLVCRDLTVLMMRFISTNILKTSQFSEKKEKHFNQPEFHTFTSFYTKTVF